VLSQAIPAFTRQAIPFILASYLVVATLSVRLEHQADDVNASHLPRYEAHFKALAPAPCREGRNGIFVAYSLEKSEPDELPRAFDASSGANIGRERMKSLVDGAGVRISSVDSIFRRPCSARPARRTCATAFLAAFRTRRCMAIPSLMLIHEALFLQSVVVRRPAC
jgi:hypothetical protein